MTAKRTFPVVAGTIPSPAGDGHERQREQASFLFLRNVLSGWVSRLLMMAIAFAITPVLVHGLGSRLYGLWAVAFTFSGFLALVDVGVNGALIRVVSVANATGEHQKISGYVSTAFSFYASVGVVLLIAVTVLRQWLVGLLGVSADLRVTAGWVFVGVTVVLVASNLTSLFTQVISALEAFHVVGAVNLVTVSMNALGVIVAVHSFRSSIGALVLANILATVLGLLLAAGVARRKCHSVSIHPRWIALSHFKEIASLSVAIQISNIAATVNFSVDKLILSVLLGLSSAGIYDLGSRLTIIVWSLCWMVASAAFPIQSRLSQEPLAALRSFYMRAERFLIVTACGLGGGLVMVAPWLVPLWLGNDFQRVVLTTQLLAVASSGLALSNVAKVTLWGLKRLTEPTIFELWRLGMHITVSSVLTWRFGFEGTLVGALVSMTLPSAWLLWTVHRRLGVNHSEWLRQAAARPFVAVVIAAAMTWLLADRIVAPYVGSSTRADLVVLFCLSGGMFSVTYIGILAWTRFFTVDDVGILSQFAPVQRLAAWRLRGTSE